VKFEAATDRRSGSCRRRERSEDIVFWVSGWLVWWRLWAIYGIDGGHCDLNFLLSRGPMEQTFRDEPLQTCVTIDSSVSTSTTQLQRRVCFNERKPVTPFLTMP
jgi:hypothetical protein